MSRILIIEDEAGIARFVELELKHEGNEVEKAADGREGFRADLRASDLPPGCGAYCRVRVPEEP